MTYDSPDARLCEIDFSQPFVTSYGGAGDPGTAITGNDELIYDY